MAGTSLKPNPTRPRGLAVWAGLDEFGSEVVSRLDRWFHLHPNGGELAAANRLLPRIAIPGAYPSDATLDDATAGSADAPTIVVDRPPLDATMDQAIAAVTSALGDLLASPLSREALTWADRDLLVPHVWLVGDIGGPESEDLSSWLVQLFRQLDNLQVEAKVFLLARNLSWSRSASQQQEVTTRIQQIVEHVCGPGQVGDGRMMVFAISDRDRIGGRYSEADTAMVIHRFADWVLLGDIPHSNLTQAARVFTVPVNDLEEWNQLPVFGSFSARTLHWDAPGLARRNRQNRHDALLAALKEPAARTFAPSAPTLNKPGHGHGVRWPDAIRLPKWSPRFRNSARREFELSQERYHAWLSRARQWRHEMLVAHDDGRSYLEQQASSSLREYLTDLDDATRTVLEDDKVDGFFHPVGRLLEVALADLRVTQKELTTQLEQRPPIGDRQGNESQPQMPLVERPEAVLAEADHDLIERLERKVTPPLLAIAGVGTFLVLWGWGVAAHRWVTAWQPLPYTRAEFMVDHSAPISERLRTRIQTTGDEVFPRVQEAFPSNVQFALWLALGVGLIVTVIAAIIVQRQQVALERSWKRIHDKGKRWRDATISTLKADLQDTENRLARENIQAALEEVEARLERLRALESALESDLRSDPDIDPVIDERIAPSIQPAPELTPLEVAQIVSTFRRGRHDDAAFREDPLQVIEDLFQDAATVAGDPEPQLHREVRHLERSLIRAIPPSGSVRTPPVVKDLEDGSAYVRTASFLAVPMAIAPYLSSNDALCHGIPVEDRFYAMVVESGMNARHVLGHQVTRGGDQTVSAEERFVDIAGTASRGIRSAGRDQAPDTLSERQDATADAHDELGLAAIAVDRTTHETEE